MNQPAAFKATYSDWKLVKTRSVVQVIFEVPLADADNAYEILGGMPNFQAERWFGIAALAQQSKPAPVEKERKEWRELQPSAQAAIRCNEPVFWSFLREQKYHPVQSVEEAATAVRKLCKVNTRADFNTNKDAKFAWDDLDADFGAWKIAEQLG